MELTIQLPSKNIKVKPWSIGDEKEYLLAVNEEDSTKDKVDFAYKKLIGDSNLHYQEKLFVLMDTKTKIMTDRIDITYTCEGCGQLTEASINTSNALEIDSYEPKRLEFDGCSLEMSYGENVLEAISFINDLENMETITDKNLIAKYIENLDIADYDYIMFVYELIDKPFRFNGKGNCLICGHEVNYSPSDEDLINTVTSVNIKDYYSLLTDLKTHGFSVEEYNNFMPFEIEMITNIIRQRRGASNG